MSAARYRSALRCATLRRERRPGFTLLDRWSWLLPRVVLTLLSSLAALGGAASTMPSPAPTTLPVGQSGVGGESEPVVVLISKTMIFVGDDPTPVVTLPAREELVVSGVPAKYKRSGPSDMLVVPLQQALERALEASARPAREDQPREAVLVADGTTPYRLLLEVLFTLGQSGVGKYHFMVRSGRKKP